MTESTLEISHVLTHLINQTGISEAALGRKIGVPRATINRLVSGKTPDPRASTLEAIADFFGITIDQLLGKRPLLGIPQENKACAAFDHSIPIIEWNHAHQWSHIVDSTKPNTHFDWVLSDPTIDGGRFALVFQGESMWPQFHEKTILIVDPDKAPKNRDFVIAYISDHQEILFRQLIIDGTYKFIRPINDMFPTIQLKDADKLIGTVVQARNNLGG